MTAAGLTWGVGGTLAGDAVHLILPPRAARLLLLVKKMQL
jgi:hypothetical protein